MTDDPGVMGNLPRSRPGRRSAKRASEVKPPSSGPKRAAAKATGAKAKPRASTKPGASTKPRAASKPGAASKPRATTKPRAATKPRATARETAPPTAVRDERVEERQGQDPLTAALKLGMAVGDAGVKAVAKIVQRLPRP